MKRLLTTSAKPIPIDWLEQPLPQLSGDDLEQAITLISQWATAHLHVTPTTTLGSTATPQQLETLLPSMPPGQGRHHLDVLREVLSQILPTNYRVDHPRFWGFVPSAPSIPSILGEWLTATANPFCGNWLQGAAAAHLEKMVLDWFRTWLGLPATAGGVLTSGGSEANLTALVVAREPMSISQRSNAVLYMSSERHWSLDRAVKMIGHQHIRLIPVQAGFQIDVEQLRKQIQVDRTAGLRPWLVVGNAGATNTGTVDDLQRLAEIAAVERLWFHVDAAYGWSACLSPTEGQHLTGIDRADSITLDPHKWFAQPYESGCLLLRNGDLLRKTFASEPDYLDDVAAREGEINFSDYGMSLSRRFRSLKIWLAVQVLGVDWHRDFVDRCCALAALAEETIIAEPLLELDCERRLSIVCFRYVCRSNGHDPNRLQQEIVRQLRERDIAFLSTTKLRGQTVIRLCFVNPNTTRSDVLFVLQQVVKIGTMLECTDDTTRND